MPAPIPQAARRPIGPRWALNASQIVILSFLGIIAIGTFLLALPIAHGGGAPHNFVDDLFTATSAVCVTGLVPLDTGVQYSVFGQIVIMLLFQIGGLGYMTLFTFSLVMVGRRLSMRDRLNLQQATDQPGMQGLIHFVQNILKFTFAVEAIGALFLAFYTVPLFGWGSGLYLAIFHSVSAFNNAGFALFPDGMVFWQYEEPFLLVLAGLVITGSLGFLVNQELVRRLFKSKRADTRWDMLVTVVVLLSVILLVGTTLLFWLFEHDNPATMAGMPWYTQLVNAFFMAAQPRSGGLHSIEVAAMDRPSLMVIISLMFIGGGPGGTAGGIKLTTFAVIIAAVVAAARGQDDVNVPALKRRLNEKIVRKAFAVAALSMTLLVTTVTVLSALEPFPLLPLLFECTSAVSTVGLSMGITPKLSDPSKVILAAAMVAGRVGMITLLLAIFATRRRSSIRYAEEPLLVG